MIRAFVILPLLLAAAPLQASEEVPFEPSSEIFADPAACRAHLAGLVEAARSGGYVAVEGPYAIVDGDVRIHMVRADATGHGISEHRCLAAKLSARSWRHSLGGDAEEPFTIDSVARKAEWLKQVPREKQ